MSMQGRTWIAPAAKRHGPHVVVAAGAVAALYVWQDNPDLILIIATAVFVSGVVGGAVEAGRWLWNRYRTK